MAVRLRMKMMGRRHRPFFRLCAVDKRGSRDGRVIEYLGHYDPMVPETDARAILKSERIDYWLGVGAQPSDRVKVLIRKYGTHGTHLDQQQAALERIKISKPTAPPPEPVPVPTKEEPAPTPEPVVAEGASAEGASAEVASAEAPSEETPAAEPTSEPGEGESQETKE
ncbi:MAG: 30S ribosomal protein S16 [Pirellulaceae bacterium]